VKLTKMNMTGQLTDKDSARFAQRIGLSCVIAAIANHMAQNDISFESIVQRPQMGDENPHTKTIILITHETTEAAVRQALAAISNDRRLVDRPQMIRIERAN